MNLKSSSSAVGNENRFRSISYTLVFLMMACVVLTVSILVHNVLPSWHANILAGILLLIVIDRLYTYRHLKSLKPLSSEWAIALGAQWIVIVLFSRFLLSYSDGPTALLADLSLVARGYIANLFTAEFITTLLFAGMIWYLPGQFLELLDEIGLDMNRALHEDTPRSQGGAVPAHQRMVNLIFTTGVILVILTALTRINLRSMVSSSTGMPDIELTRFSGGEAGALLYFVFGLGLLSLSRLMSLQTHWNRQHIPVSSQNLPRQWALYSVFFLLILAVLVSLLPSGDSLGFFSVLGTLLGFLLQVLLFLSQLIITLILILFSLPFLLLGKAPPFIGSAPPPLPTLPAQPVEPMTSNAIWELLKSILLWGSLLAVIVFALTQFLRQHDGILTALRKSRVANWLILAWQWLYKNVDKARSDLARAITDGWQSLVSRLEGKRVLPAPGWISLRRLDARRRVYFFYLAMIRRGGEQGLRREPSQTPSEYAVTLEQALPSAREDIDAITTAFVQARYSRQDVNAEEADYVKATWERIRHALRSKSKTDRDANK